MKKTQDKQLHLGDLFRSRREPGKAGLPVSSVTMHGGLVQRDTLDRKSSGNSSKGSPSNCSPASDDCRGLDDHA